MKALDNEDENRKINRLVEAKYKSMKQEHLEEALKHVVCHDSGFSMTLKKEQTTCIFHSSEIFELELDAVLEFAGKS